MIVYIVLGKDEHNSWVVDVFSTYDLARKKELECKKNPRGDAFYSITSKGVISGN